MHSGTNVIDVYSIIMYVYIKWVEQVGSSENAPSSGKSTTPAGTAKVSAYVIIGVDIDFN